MICTVGNKQLTVAVNALGAELQSIRDGSGNEYLWQGDPAFWRGRAYNLFPIVGRLNCGKYLYRGKEFQMKHHGFTRETTFEVESFEGTKIVFLMKSSDETLKQYPFLFEYRIRYTLEDAKLDIEVEVKNTDEKELIFAVGGHPGFNLPLEGKGEFEDCYLEFSCKKQAKKFVLSPACLTTDKKIPFPLEDGIRLRLEHGLFDEDAICLTDMCREVSLKFAKSERRIKVSFPDMPYLGIWHTPQKPAPYICIEPWSSMPSMDGERDDLETKPFMERLAPGALYRNTVSIEII